VAKRKPVRVEFESRRRKEQLAFLVVKFLKSFVIFEAIREQFENASCRADLSDCGLFEKVRDLEEGLAYDLKEIAHSLFRGKGGASRAEEPAREQRGARRLDGLKRSIEARTIDSYVGTGFHYLLMLRELLYQIERYAPEYEKEREEIARIEEITRKSGRALSEEEQREIERLRALGEISLKLGSEAEELARRVIQRCIELFKSTAEVVRHLVEGAGDNEILIQNLLQNLELLDTVYGKESAERIFSDLFRQRDIPGETGMEKAFHFVRERCGNVTGLPQPG
jgi:hypothetical protein